MIGRNRNEIEESRVISKIRARSLSKSNDIKSFGINIRLKEFKLVDNTPRVPKEDLNTM